MKRISLIFTTILTVAASCRKADVDLKLKELDQVIRDREIYAGRYESKINELKLEYRQAQSNEERWNAAYEIYSLYRNSQVDSSIVYLELMSGLTGDDYGHQVKTVLSQADAMIASRRYPQASELISSLDTLQMNDVQKGDYYNTALLLYATQASDESLPEDVRRYNVQLRYQTRLKYIACPGIDNFEKVRRPAIQMYEDGNIKSAIAILEKLVESAPDNKKAHAAYSLAKAYEESGRMDMVKLWFAQAAIYNILIPSGEHLSLYELSIILYGENDLKRALSYSQTALEEALACNYNTRIINSANSQLSIVRAAEYREQSIMNAWMVILIILLSLASTIFFFWRKTVSQSRRIEDSASELRRMNCMLEEAGKIKEGYVFRYINLSARYLRLVEEYRHDLRITLKEGGEAALREKLRQPESEIQALNHKQFYSIFDETFMGIFPDFVSRVNSLLCEDSRFTVHGGRELPTGLRILAAIRLGITDSGKIAEFLNCAPRSVYTHRSKIKKAALCPPEDFERLICETNA